MNHVEGRIHDFPSVATTSVEDGVSFDPRAARARLAVTFVEEMCMFGMVCPRIKR